jgi:hypothetical protein
MLLPNFLADFSRRPCGLHSKKADARPHTGFIVIVAAQCS